MNNLEIGVSRPHYVNRNQQFDKKECEKSPKIKKQARTIPVKNIHPPRSRHDHQEELNKVKELKEWLLGLLSSAKDNWEEELANRRNWVMAMREGHRQKLMKILQYIQSLRKQAYEKYRHVCDRTRQEGCTDCRQRASYFNDLARNYLTSDRPKARKSGKENINSKGQVDKGKEKVGNIKDSARPSIDQIHRNLSKRGSRLSHITSSSQGRPSTTPQDFYLQTDKVKLKKPHSKFKRVENQRDSRNKSKEEELDSDIKLLLSSQREEGLEYRFSQSKKEDTIDAKYQSRIRKSSQFPIGNADQANSRRIVQGTRAEDSFSKRDSKSSLRQSILRPSGKNTFQDSQFIRSGQFKLIDAEEAMTRGQSGPSGRFGRFGLIRNSSGGQLPDEVLERSIKKRKSQGRGRNNRYIKKNSLENNDIDIDITSSEDDKEDLLKREREGIQELLKEKEYFRDDHYKKVSRYRRQRMIYDILKREILVNDGIEEAPEAEIEADEKDIHYTQMSSNYDLSASRQIDHTTLPTKPKRKKYSLMERKESLISKLALLNQGNTIESIRGKIEEILHERGLMAQGKQEKVNGKNIVEKFISEVLKITDLKRLMKEKFIKQADWSPKMRQMHQFYTYLEYSMEAFHSKLNKTTQLGWKELTYEGKLCEAKLDGLILDSQMRDWEGLDLSNLGEENHREIQCSMKYYGIDVKRLKNLNQISYQVAANKTLNPVFSSVGQRSMKCIQEVTQSLYASPSA